MIQYLSGVEPGELGKKRRTKAERKARRKELLKNPLKAIKTIAVAPARASFLLAVSLNVMKLAKRLAQGYKKNPTKLTEFWKKLGGDEAKLKQAIEKGSKSKLTGHLGVALEVTIATATPIIIAAVKLLKDLKSDKEGDDDKDKPVLDDLKDKLDTDDDDKETDKNTDKDTGEKKPFYKNPFVIGGAVLLVGAGVYFATKKK
jgi:hypothetical protein